MTNHAHRRENTVLRGQLFEKEKEDPTRLAVRRNVYVIPNAIIAEQFKPRPSKPSETSVYFLSPPHTLKKKLTYLTVTIVVLSRLAYRKGIDLLVGTAPRICATFPNVRFVVGELFAYTFKHTTIGNLSLPEQEATVQN